MLKVRDNYKGKEYWVNENLLYLQPYFRLEKCARIVNGLAGGQACDLLDVGCGPATLSRLLDRQINYFGIDIAVHNPSPNLMEMDFARNEIGFGGRQFDIVVAAGVFEYMGDRQDAKLAEIGRLLKKGGKFVVTYTNFSHLHRIVDYEPYNNIQPLGRFRASLASHFRIDRWFASSHNWQCTEPRRRILKAVQMPLSLYVPLISPLLAVNYFFICSLKD